MCVFLGSDGSQAREVTGERGLAVHCKSQGSQHSHWREFIANPSFVQPGLTSRHQRHAPLSQSSADCLLSPADGQQSWSVPHSKWVEHTKSPWSESHHHKHVIVAFLFSFVILIVASAKCGFFIFLMLFSLK